MDSKSDGNRIYDDKKNLCEKLKVYPSSSIIILNYDMACDAVNDLIMDQIYAEEDED